MEPGVLQSAVEHNDEAVSGREAVSLCGVPVQFREFQAMPRQDHLAPAGAGYLCEAHKPRPTGRLSVERLSHFREQCT